MKALCECALQLNNVLIDEKLKLVDSLAVCAGENLAESFKKNLQISNPSYAAALQLYEDNGIKPVNNYTFAGTRWTKGHLTYDNVDVLSNLDQIYNCFLSKGRKNQKTGNLYVDRVSMNAFHYIFFHRRADFGW